LNDQELLEQAAKAAQLTILGSAPGHPGLDVCDEYRNDARRWWSPLTDDGDAFRLAVRLGLDLRLAQFLPEAFDLVPGAASVQVDAFEKARRAIVSAAAEIGKNMTA
jgi:hypothetical protein